MKNSTATPLPVSKKAYSRFVERINSVIADPGKRAGMLEVLDKYLAGNRTDYSAPLSPECAMAFEMLRFEIDLAITRSANARRRALARKAEAAAAETNSKHDQPYAAPRRKSDLDYWGTLVEPTDTTVRQNAETEDNDSWRATQQSRRERRDIMRRAQPKNRWQKL